jgi:tripartite-type tricarboxylate transporter receptor subunit TctC
VQLPAAAQSYPERPITLVVPFTAGGDADLSARNLAQRAQPYVKEPLVVVNRAGANGAIGSQVVKEAKPDGYTLLLARIGSQTLLPALQPSLSYKWNDFTFLGLLERNPFVCVVHVESPYRTLADLVGALKANPGKLNYSTSGPATILNFGPQLLFDTLKLGKDAATMVAYKGGGDAAVAVLSREVDFNCANLTSVIGHIKGGKLRALMTTTPERWKDIPDVPTVRELGYPQLEAIVGWSALYGPPGMSQELVAYWADALSKLSRDAAWVAGTERFGGIPAVLSPAETAKFVAEQFQVYDRLGKQLGIELK